MQNAFKMGFLSWVIGSLGDHDGNIVFPTGIQCRLNQGFSLGFEVGFGLEKGNHGFSGYFLVQTIGGKN